MPGSSLTSTTLAAVIVSTPLALLTAAAPAGAGDWRFTEVAAAAGLDYEHGFVGGLTSEPRMASGGVAAGDYDRDGWSDLYVVRGSIGPNLLFRNLGDGTFAEVGAAAGVAIAGEKGCGPAFLDLDGDGWLDLFLGGVEDTRPRLFRNLGDGTFEERTAAAGVTSDVNTFSAAAADYDRDGDLDLFLTHWRRPDTGGARGHLWRNAGDATFEEIDAEAGFIAPYRERDHSFSPNFVDVDDDGWLDLLVASDFGTSRTFRNRGDGTFAETTSAVITDENGMGAAVGDYDNDGDLDWFVSSIWDADGQGNGWGMTGNRLYRNRGDGVFDDATEAAGVRAGYWGWGSCFADFDNDGDLDLFHVNGFQLLGGDEFYEDPARFFDNQGDGTFDERAAELGIADTGQGRGVVCFDYDRDGDLDVFIANNSGPPSLYRNDGGNLAGHYLQVALRGPDRNSEGVGARLTLTAGGATQIRELRAGNNFVSQNPVLAHFGLGATTVVDQLTVRWPDGTVETRVNVAADQLLTLQYGAVAGAAEIPALAPVGVAVLALLLLLAGAVRLRPRR